jgi:lipopolysaccharide biosynthesis regulator YciM
MDSLDKISIIILIVLVAVMVVIGMDYHGGAESNVSNAAGINRNPAGVSEIPDSKIKMLRGLVAGNNIKKAESLLEGMLKEYPYEGEPHMLMGDIMMRRQDPVAAIYSYKEAVDLNPDYVDKKAPLFQGRKIKVAVDEARESINASLSRSPGDRKMKTAKKTMYYLLRRLAGSCG